MAQNFDVFDFSLDEEDIRAIASLDTQESAFFSHYDPATVEFMTGLGK
jgi:diketogulonate reductase-like aldo/keto reductase